MTNSKEQVTRFFSERAADWAACYSDPNTRSVSAQNLISRQRIVLEMIERVVPPGSRILDAGCGTGEMAALLMRRGYEVCGLDIAEPMIRYARARCGSDRFRVGDIEHIPFPDNTFDAVVCLGVLEYLDVDEWALREVWRVLKPGGSAVVSTPNAACPFYPTARMLVGLIAAARSLDYFVKDRLPGARLPVRRVPDETRHRKYHSRKWLRLLRSIRLEPEDWVCHSWGWYSSSYPVPLARRLSRQIRPLRQLVERVFGPARLGRTVDGFARSRAVNWLLAEQVVSARAVK